jgi:hypothetical protein
MTDDDFLAANAIPSIATFKMSEAILDIVRAIASNDSEAMTRTDQLVFALKLYQRLDPPVRLDKIVGDAVAEINARIGERASGDKSERFCDSARAGLRYLVEMSATDGFAKGRTTQAFFYYEERMKIALG